MLESLSYDMMGPTEDCLLNKNGDRMYLTIHYRRSGQSHPLRVPKHYSAYFARSPIFIRHNFGTFSSIIFVLMYFLDQFYVAGFYKYRLVAITINVAHENSLSAVCSMRYHCRLTRCDERPYNWFQCPDAWKSPK